MKFTIFFTILGLAFSPFFAFAHGDDTHIEILPSSIAYQEGDDITVAVNLNAVEPATAFRVHINYDADSLTVEDIVIDDKSFPFWATQKGEDGLIELEALSPAPGFQGETPIAMVTLKAMSSGSSELTLSTESLVLNTADENILIPEEERMKGEADNMIKNEQGDPKESVASATPSFNMGIVAGVLVIIAIAGVVLFLMQRRK